MLDRKEKLSALSQLRGECFFVSASRAVAALLVKPVSGNRILIA